MLYSRCVTKGEEVSPALFQKLEKLESPGEKTGDFSMLNQAKNYFLEKESFNL